MYTITFFLFFPLSRPLSQIDADFLTNSSKRTDDGLNFVTDMSKSYDMRWIFGTLFESAAIGNRDLGSDFSIERKEK